MCRVACYCPTANTLRGNTKTGHKYRWWRRKFEDEFGTWLVKIPPAKRLRRVTITREYGKGKRAYDRVNFMAGCKPLLDTVVNFGALYDDSENWVDDFYRQFKSLDGLDYLEVKVEEMEP